MPTRRRPHSWARRLTALAAGVLVAALVAGCTDGDQSADAPTATTAVPAPEERAVDDPLAVTAYADPTATITATVGERFALLLDAEPTEGYRWEVVGQGDPAVVLPLGSQFVARESVVAATTTTTATTTAPVPPPPPDPPAEPAEVPAPGDEPAVTTAVGEEPAAPPETAPTTTTVPTRSLQVLSYVARAAGRTTITVRYVRIGTPADAAPTVTFTVEVPPPPPLF